MTKRSSALRAENRWGDESRRVLALARRYLRFGTRSTAELRAYLATRGVSPTDLEPAVSTCSRAGLLDDAVCAKLWATTLADRGYAWEAIRGHLLSKRLEPQLVERTLRPLQARADDASRIRDLVDARLRGRARTDPRLRTRLAQLLVRRGFDADLIERVLIESFGPASSHAES